ncbi:MAG: uroporphyrinogen decarboxylase family protein [Armatimonadota bacterium]
MNSMTPGERIRATYDFKPLDHLIRTEFYIWEEALTRWKDEGLPDNWAEQNLFNYEPTGYVTTGVNLGWCEPAFMPLFESKVIESTDDYEIIQDVAGRWLKVFKGRRHGFMPDYLKHAVTNMADWNEVSPRLDLRNEERWKGLEETVSAQKAAADSIGGMLSQMMIGGYMYLRAICGPEDLLYMFYDQPEVVHAAMQGWLDLADAALERVQAVTEIDEISVGEDICYNHGLLISPDAVRAFLSPYYRQVLENARRRQKRKLNFQVDTDGDCRPAIPLYYELGMTRMSPFEVASGCDVVEIGKQYPNLVMSGGIDKRILAAGKDAIDAHLNHIIPFMVERGGYYPTCDHGVPDDVSFENYMYYRKRLCELDHK